MFINEIITQDNYFISPHWTIHEGLETMHTYNFLSAPILDRGSLQGVIIKEDLSLITDKREKISHHIRPRLNYALDTQHIYEALQIMSAFQLDTLPIVDSSQEYKGYLNIRQLSLALNQTLGNNEQGAIVIIEVGKHDISFSHISHLIELENTRILNMALRYLPDSTKTEITIKLETKQISSVVSSLWRNNYTVKATFNDGSDYSDLKNRYEHLMNFLDL